MAIRDVQRLWPRDHALGEGAAITDDQIVLAQVHTLEGEGIQRQERLIMAPHERHTLHEAGADIHLPEAAVDAAAVVDRGVNRRLRV